ncbi:MAG TPA: thioredoxin domain-containing protein [Crenalkalicoccus sp.]|jgi:protein-disulfide isomerase|nr:thioredoxin domain-containing protein [Crenalkalicoccus sp.]
MTMLRFPVTAGDHIRGDPNAPATLLEYGDYECPHCGAAHPVVNQMLAHFGPRLRFVYRHFPLTQIHPFAEPAAETAEFAGAHGRFWEMHDLLFENQSQLGLPLLVLLARSLGLSGQELQAVLEAQTHAPKIQRDFMSGVRSGVNGTPTFFIGDRRHDGPHDYGSLVMAITAQFFAPQHHR